MNPGMRPTRVEQTWKPAEVKPELSPADLNLVARRLVELNLVACEAAKLNLVVC